MGFITRCESDSMCILLTITYANTQSHTHTHWNEKINEQTSWYILLTGRKSLIEEMAFSKIK